MWAILRDKERREALFRKALELHDYNVDYDWFHRYFQDEHADRAQKKQDFTPNSVATLLSALVSGEREVGDTYYEPCAGTGGITIRQWDADRRATPFFEYVPSMFLYQAEELSDRAVPFLLFNLAIRGMNASVVQVDVLSRKGAKGAWLVQNTNDDHLQYSAIHLFPYDDASAEYFNVEWTAFEANRYEPFDPVGDFPAHLGGNAFLEAVRHEVAEKIVTCDKCSAVFPDGIAFDYSPDYGDICEVCAEGIAEE
ncbi:N-6 DNA methylase [Sporosarcina sp. ACRSL]|uniref:N-6 DNA methylase n=1 Tax=Sporosarcina sp. ACRSL TaxID=2918215 RepID=UPI001EF5EC0E|nr:N-6 DNA methylase [Sporosarcina sp. ACRSL]MCG7345329.1 N-6 DNA methylase [Sporosarcina sp. ACRSL]